MDRPKHAEAPGDEGHEIGGTPSDMPTIAPPFDLDEYARSSDSRLRASAVHGVHPAHGQRIDVHIPSFDAPTRPPQITLTDEDELESARLRSVLMPSEPPPAFTPAGGSVLPPTAQPPSYRASYEPDPFADGSDVEVSVDEADPLARMQERLASGDYTAALAAAEALLAVDPNEREAARAADEARLALQQLYIARIGPLGRVPHVLVSADDLPWLAIDHRAGFLLSHVDGVSSLEMILDVSGMPSFDALRILFELADQHVIGFR